jgi:hypothetical protein
MITGDYSATARAIAQRAGLDDGSAVLSGEQMEKLGEGELQERARTATVVALIMPEATTLSWQWWGWGVQSPTRTVARAAMTASERRARTPFAYSTRSIGSLLRCTVWRRRLQKESPTLRWGQGAPH